jgi:hypothetical protein
MEITISGDTHRLKMNGADARVTYGETDTRYGYVPDSYVDVWGKGWNKQNTKEYPAHLRISIDEIQEMMQALTEEVRVCHQFLRENKLLEKLEQAKRKEAEERDALEKKTGSK